MSSDEYHNLSSIPKVRSLTKIKEHDKANLTCLGLVGNGKGKGKEEYSSEEEVATTSDG